MRKTKNSLIRKNYNEYIIENIQELLKYYEENNIKKNKKTLEDMLLDVNNNSNDEDKLHKIAEHLEILINFSGLDYGYKHKIEVYGSK
jgi:adenylyl- and sulfurtransferase ThiI